jgi:protein tyrosine phosphatase
MVNPLSRVSASIARSRFSNPATPNAHESAGAHGASPRAASSSRSAKPPAHKLAAQTRPTQTPTDPWHTLQRQPSSTEHSRIARYLPRLHPRDWAFDVEDRPRVKLPDALKSSELECYDIRESTTKRTSGLQFSASVHPTNANIENFVDQLYQAGTHSLVNLAQANEYDIEDPIYYNTGGETIEIGDYLVRGVPVGQPVYLGKNMPSRDNPAQDITLRFYEATIVPKAEVGNPAAVHTLRAFEVDNLRDGTAFEPGQLAKLAMHILKAGGSKIHVHCFGGFDRTGMTVAMGLLIKDLLDGKRIHDPVEAVVEKVNCFRKSRGEWTSVQGDAQLEALINEAMRLCAMPRERLRALYGSIPTLGVAAASGGRHGRSGQGRHAHGKRSFV